MTSTPTTLPSPSEKDHSKSPSSKWNERTAQDQFEITSMISDRSPIFTTLLHPLNLKFDFLL